MDREAVQESKLLDRFVVSMEDPEIEAVSKEANAEVIKRPGHLATDTALSVDVVKHV